MGVEIRVHPKFSSRVQRARLTRIAGRALRAGAPRANAALTIYVTHDAEIRALNRQFHATNRATDVLSFPALLRHCSGGILSEAEGHAYLGDVVISYERARAQAHAAGWPIADELDLLAVHGILHLLGYDDLSPRTRRVMWARQAEILGRKVKGEEL